ncbi:MAG: PEP-CTERM sorting domain-containing protein [Planctomycetia bacterium]|nr:PEP-CTERM sorting domain-containing protein [Planctomycetia bacterium]
MIFLRKLNRFVLLIPTIVGFSCIGTNVLFAEPTWIENQSGSLLETSNWNNGFPSATEAGSITGGTQTISDFTLNDFSLNVKGGTTTVAGIATIGNGTNAVTFNMPSWSELKFTGGLTIKSGSSVNITDGKIGIDSTVASSFDDVTIGVTTDNVANFMTIESGATVTTTRKIRLGREVGSAGTLNVSGMLETSDEHVLVGLMGTGSVNVDGGKLSMTHNNAQMILGDSNDGNCVGNVTITNGGTITGINSFSIGDKSTATGTVTISGKNSGMNVKSSIFVGKEGKGSLSITDGAYISSNQIKIGESSSGNGTMTISGKDSTGTASTVTATDFILVGCNGNGTLNVDSGAKINSKQIMINDTGNGVGTMTISGSGTNVNIDSAFYVGHNGQGALTISDGASVTVGVEFIVGNNKRENSNNILTIDNATLTGNGNHIILGRAQSSHITMRGDNATINFNGRQVCGLAEYGAQDVVFDMEGGAFNVNTTPTTHEGYSLHQNAIQNHSGGTMNIGKSDLQINLQLKDQSVYNLSGNGILNVTGEMNKADSATFNMTGGTLSTNKVNFHLVQEGGNLSPGIVWDENAVYNIGTTTLSDYTLKTGATITLEIAGDTFDQIIVTGNTIFEQGANIELAYDESVLDAGDTFGLFELKGNVTGEEYLQNALSAFDSTTWNVKFDDVSNMVNFTYTGYDPNAVPEPATWGLLSLGVAIFFLRRMKK